MSAFGLGLLVARLKFIHERESSSDGVWNLSVSGFKLARLEILSFLTNRPISARFIRLRFDSSATMRRYRLCGAAHDGFGPPRADFNSASPHPNCKIRILRLGRIGPEVYPPGVPTRFSFCLRCLVLYTSKTDLVSAF